MLCGACYFLCNISRMNWVPPPSLTLKAPQLLSPFPVFTTFNYGLQLLNTFCLVSSSSATNYKWLFFFPYLSFLWLLARGSVCL